MNAILISGSTGFVGSQLVKHLQECYEIIGFGSRELNDEKQIESLLKKWENNRIHAVIHLAGANIFGQPWNEEYKKKLIQSRVLSVLKVHRILDKLKIIPKMVIGASAVGYYGNDKKIVDETSPPGNDFLSKICVDWENTYREVIKDVPLTILRLGIVTHHSGGAMKRMLFPFRLGAMFLPAGGNFPFNYIPLENVIEFIYKILQNEIPPDIYNLVSSHQHTYKSYISNYKCPFLPFIPVPMFFLKFFLGERAGVLVTSTRVISTKYHFH